MKPIVTWVVLANAKTVRVVAHNGPGKGLTALAGEIWHATEILTANDKAGFGHSIAGPGVAAVQQTNRKLVHDTLFAKEVIDHLSKDCVSKKFDRLILISGPHMLGILRASLDGPLRAALVGEIPKDLSAQSLIDVETHLGEFIAV